ncbi:MAG: hypothetical protein RBS40_09110 [Rhodocyclaceae bacterium]|jgi:hypothetical protein|nr:hypothetical protein [Rhodocyclaceae bacterium]
MFSPRWDEEGVSVVFDSGSGDYWVLADDARTLLEDLNNRPQQTAQFEWLEKSRSFPTESLQAVMGSLVQFGLIQTIDAP